MRYLGDRVTDGARSRSGVRWAASLVTATLAIGVLNGAPALAVAGGGPAAAGSYAFVAKIDVGDGFRGCTGALVAAEWVVTASSCFAENGQPVAAGRPSRDTTATIGRTDLTGTAGQVARVVELVPRTDRDVVLGRLARPIPGIAPVQIASAAPEVGGLLRVAGYGRTGTQWVPDRLHTAMFTVDGVSATTIGVVGSTAEASICKGDAGGPALREDSDGAALVAINSTSWQGGCFTETETRRGATEARVDDIGDWIRQTARRVIRAPDYNGDARSDLALTGVSGWTTVPVATARGDGSFAVTNKAITDFGLWASSGNVRILSGDFNGDGRSDMALTAVAGWTTLPVAMSNGDGSFTVTNRPLANFPGWAAAPGVKVQTGDVNGDGRTDIALTGGPGWSTVPVAFANGDGSFTVTNKAITDVGLWATSGNVRVLTGDFNGDGRTDIALTGVTGWTTVPVATSNGDGSFTVTNRSVANFPGWAAAPGVKVLTGDVNGDGRTDVALTGGPGWSTVPVAFANGDGSFTVTNKAISNFGLWATSGNVRVLTGDFNGDGRTDIALTGVTGWTTVPVATSNGDGSFTVANHASLDFARWASTPGLKILTGDFTGDGRSDLALTGGPGWWTLPVAASTGDGRFAVTNAPITDFGGWASLPTSKVVSTPETAPR